MIRPHVFLFCLLAPGAISAQSYTFLSYNIRYDNAADSLDRWDLRKTALAEEVMRHQPQVIGLQEGLDHQLRYLDARWPRYQRYGVGREDGLSKGEFAPVYYDTTAFALLYGHTLWLAPDPTRPAKGWDAACERIATLVVLRDKTSGDSLWVVNTHWDHVGKRARRNSAAMIEGALRKPRAKGRRIVVMGDLNARPDSRPIRDLARWMTDSCPPERSSTGTFNDFGRAVEPLKRIDYIWHGPDHWELISYEVPRPIAKGRHLSDHFPVVVVLRAR